MKLVLVGPGALGCLLSMYLAKGLEVADSVVILDHNEHRSRLLQAQGLVYRNGRQTLNFPVVIETNPVALKAFDGVILCVKSYDVAATLEFCQPLLSKETLLVFMQNGISHLDLALPIPELVAAYGTTTEGATLLGTGDVRHGGHGQTFLGFIQPVKGILPAKLNALRNIMARGGLDVSPTEDIKDKLWAKLFVNVAINGLSGIYRCRNGELLLIPEAMARMTTALNEAVAVAKALQIAVPPDPHENARLVCANTANNVSSMLQDIQNGKRTEIDAINGAISRLGQRFNLPTPENDRIVAQIKAIEADVYKSSLDTPS